MNPQKTKSSISIKLIVFSVYGERLMVYVASDCLPKVKYRTYIALDKTAEDIAVSVFGISVRGYYIEQLYTVTEKADISIVYFLLLPSYRISNRKNWLSVNSIGFISEHAIIEYAIQRLRWKIEYTNIVYSLLPDTFTFSQLQNIYEAILQTPLDKRNFRKKIFSLDILESTGKRLNLGKARPAEMYSFHHRKLSYVKIL